MKRTFVVAALATVAASAQAAPVAYSGLEGQTAGVLTNTINDGIGMNGWDPQNTTAGYKITNASPLTFGSLATSADGNYIAGTGSIAGEGGYTNLGRQVNTDYQGAFDAAGTVSDPWTVKTVDQGTVWFSFLTRSDRSNPDVYFQLHENNIAWNDGAGVKIGLASGTWSAALTSGSYASTSAAYAVNTTTLLVGRYVFNGADSSFHFWAFSDPAAVTLGGADLNPAAAASAITGVAATSIDFRSFKAYLNNDGADRAAIDEIRFGTSFADVTPAVPEPGMIGLIAMGGLLLGRRRA